MKPKAFDMASTAADYALSASPPTYGQLDCYTFVRQCVRDNGGDMKYAGSNDLFRNGITEAMPLSDALAKGKLKAGWVLFIVEPVDKRPGKTPEKYWHDGRGDASHMGLYTDLHCLQDSGDTYLEVVHSSSTRGGVAVSTLKNAWNWAGRLKDVDYSDWDKEQDAETEASTGKQAPTGEGAQLPLAPNTAVVLSDTLRARKTLSTKNSANVVMQLQKGQVLEDIHTGYAFDSGEPAVYAHIRGTKHPYCYVAICDERTGEQYLRLSVPAQEEGAANEPPKTAADQKEAEPSSPYEASLLRRVQRLEVDMQRLVQAVLGE